MHLKCHMLKVSYGYQWESDKLTVSYGYQWESDKLTVEHHKREPRGQSFRKSSDATYLPASLTNGIVEANSVDQYQQLSILCHPV